MRGRVLLADLTYAARSGEEDLWIADAYSPNYTEEPVGRPKPVDCP